MDAGKEGIDPLKEIIIDIAEGNPGAITLCMRLQVRDRWIVILDHLLKVGPKGSQLWMLYKDTFKADFTKFAEHLEKRMSEGSNIRELEKDV